MRIFLLEALSDGPVDGSDNNAVLISLRVEIGGNQHIPRRCTGLRPISAWVKPC